MESNPSADLTVRQPKQPKISAFADFPTELIQLVFTYCDTETLKSARLGCSIWAYKMIGPFLFDTVTLIPHLYFMDRFLFTFRSSPLTKHMKRMVIDLRWLEQMFGLDDLLPEGFSYDPLRGANESSLFTLEQLVKLYHVERTEHLRVLESASFSAIFSITTSLAKMELNFGLGPYECSPEEKARGQVCSPMPVALKALLASFGIGQDGAMLAEKSRPFHRPHIYWSLAAPLVFLPCLKQLVFLHFHPVMVYDDWYDQSPSDIESASIVHPIALFNQVFRRLSHFDVRTTSWTDDMEEDTAMFTMDILRSASNVPSLRLHIQDTLECCPDDKDDWGDAPRHPYENSIPLLKRFLQLQTPSVSLPNIRFLWLQNLVCSPQELEHFLTRETPKLQSFTLVNCVLDEREHWRRHLPCCVLTLKRLRRKLHLTSVDFGGFLKNLGRQHWHITEKPACSAPNSVKAQMIEWFLDKSAPDESCPMNVFEVGYKRPTGVHLCATDKTWSVLCPEQVVLEGGSETETTP